MARNGASSRYCEGGGALMSFAAVNASFDAHVIVDLSRMPGITTRQLADYVAMVGLADVRLDAHTGDEPTILRLFRHPKLPPRGLSAWDRALLYALYDTRQSSMLQESDMEATVLKRITLPQSTAQGPSRPPKSPVPLWADEVLPQRHAKVTYWYHIAAARGSAAAQYDLAVRYMQDQGVPQSYARAAQWYRKAAGHGRVAAQYNLGVMYLRGPGVPRNYTEAARWFRKAAERGNADAQFNLGLMYADGRGVPRDPVSAYKWWMIARADSSLLDNARDWSLNRMKESASRMTPDQIARACRRASGWLAAHRPAP